MVVLRLHNVVEGGHHRLVRWFRMAEPWSPLIYRGDNSTGSTRFALSSNARKCR